METNKPLLPCPHCGGEAQLITGNLRVSGTKVRAAWVCCTVCQAKTNYIRRALHPEDYIDRAIIAWNMRECDMYGTEEEA